MFTIHQYYKWRGKRKIPPHVLAFYSLSYLLLREQPDESSAVPVFFTFIKDKMRVYVVNSIQHHLSGALDPQSGTLSLGLLCTLTIIAPLQTAVPCAITSQIIAQHCYVAPA